MTDKQPEALRLANEYYEDHWIVGTKTWCREAVEELRRLHQSEGEGWRYANELEQERKLLHEVNEELVGALYNLRWAASERDKKNRIRQFDDFMDAADVALAKAQGDNNEV